MLAKDSEPALKPEVQVTLALHDSLIPLLKHDSPLNTTVQTALAEALDRILSILGIPGKPKIEIIGWSPNRLSNGEFMRIWVNGSLCLFSDELVSTMQGYTNNTFPQTSFDSSGILTWLKNLANGKSERPNPDQKKFVEFLVNAIAEIIKLTPTVLFGEAQLDAYIATLPQPTSTPPVLWPPTAAWLMPILTALLDLGISIGDQQTVANVLGQSNDRSQADVIEDLIVALRPQVIEIQLPYEYLKQLTQNDPSNGTGMFAFLREGLFSELGVCYPDFRFTPTEHLKPNTFAFRINYLVTHPYIGLLPNQCLVNDSAERLQRENIECQPAANPATGLPSTVVGLDRKGQLEAEGLTTWNQMGYLILSFADVLRKHGACFIDKQFISEKLDQLGKTFPAVISAVRSTLSLEQVTRVLRALAAEELSIRNLIFVLELLLDYYSVSPELNLPENKAGAGGTHRYHPDHLMQFIRSGLTDYISHKYAKGTKSIIAYLLDPEIEKMLTGPVSSEDDPSKSTGIDEHRYTLILNAIHAEIAYLPATVQTPLVLTTEEARPRLAKLLRQTFPRIPVLSYDELPPQINVQPVARINLSS